MESQQEIWNILAPRWNNFRHKSGLIFPKLAKKWEKGKVLDLGCGNSRNLIPFAKEGFSVYGVDFSKEMINLSKTKFKKEKLNGEFKLGELTKIPYKDNYFDYVICIASFHHLNKEEQTKCLEEIKRVLKKDGIFMISVWNKWQKRFLFSKKESQVPWKTKEKEYNRYYYFFNYFEFKNLLKKNGFKIVKSKGIFGDEIQVFCKIS